MAPTEEVKKKKKVPTVPDFIDDKFIATLSPEKQHYWKNRKAGKRGIPSQIPEPKMFKTADVSIGFDSEGHMIAKTRQMRRQKLPSDNKYTKATHAIKKARNK